MRPGIPQTSGNIDVIMQHNAQDLVTLFNKTFLTTDNTELAGGYNEPLYQPATPDNPTHRILFTRDYFASALHEVAHWCVAGPARRQRVDYGYWYEPDGRTQEQQHLFEQVEVRPQAFEWIFANACRYRFRISADNLMTGNSASHTFKDNIFKEVQTILCTGLPARAQRFTDALARFYGCHSPLEGFSRQYLDQ